MDMKIGKRIGLMLLVCSVLVGCWPAAAQEINTPKEEVVYASLAPDGTVTGIYVVNSFELEAPGTVVDFGEYESVQNLTSTQSLTYENGEVRVWAEQGVFYYQGNLRSRELPWKFSIRYFLDGEERSAAELGGQDGSLEIRIAVQKNPLVSPVFTEACALQISLSLDGRQCQDIMAEGGVVASAGGSRQVSFTVLPGEEKTLTLTARVRNFSMDGITIAGLPLGFSFDVGKLDFGQLTGLLQSLQEGIGKLDDGAVSLAAGASGLADGLEQSVAGLDSFRKNLRDFASGLEKLEKGVQELQDGLDRLSQQNDALLAGAKQLVDAAFQTASQQLSQQFGAAAPTLTLVNYEEELERLADLYPVTAELLGELKSQLDGAASFYAGLVAYTGGVSNAAGGLAEWQEGLNEAVQGSSQLVLGADTLADGLLEMAKGSRDFAGGVRAYRNGTAALKEQTANMDVLLEERLEQTIQDMLRQYGGTGEIASFVSARNTQMESVQFVIKTEGVSLPASPEEPNPPQEQLSFWQKLLRLFGIY